jgi:hypothetical protein
LEGQQRRTGNQSVFTLAINPSDPNVIYAGTGDQGIFRSTNGGADWSARNGGLTTLRISSIAIDRSNPDIIYAGTLNGVFQLQSERIEITSAAFEAPKKLTISGINLSKAPRVLINDVDRTDFIVDASDTTIQLRGKAKKLKLKPGDNSDTGGHLNRRGNECVPAQKLKFLDLKTEWPRHV